MSTNNRSIDLMTTEDADKLKAQVDALTWAQLLALWKWLTLVVWQRMGRGLVYESRQFDR